MSRAGADLAEGGPYMDQAADVRKVVIAGGGYAGLHVALRLASWLEGDDAIEITLVDRHDYHQVLTELPRVVGGSRAGAEVRIPLERVLDYRVVFDEVTVTGFDLPQRRLLTSEGPLAYDRLVLALGSRPNDFDIPGLADRVLHFWSADDADRALQAVEASVQQAARVPDSEEQQRLLTVVIGGAGATGVELAGELAEMLPRLARRYRAPAKRIRVILVEAGPTILPGSSRKLIAQAAEILQKLGVDVRTNALIAEATAEGFTLKGGQIIRGGVYIWAGGVKGPEVVVGSGLPVGHNDRLKVDQYLRVLDHPRIYAAGDLAAAVNRESGRVLPPLAQVALEEGETVARNLHAEIEGRPLHPFVLEDRGIVVSVGEKSGVADVAGRTVRGRLAHALKDAIEWEYRQSVKHLRGWSPI